MVRMIEDTKKSESQIESRTSSCQGIELCAPGCVDIAAGLSNLNCFQLT